MVAWRYDIHCYIVRRLINCRIIIIIIIIIVNVKQAPRQQIVLSYFHFKRPKC